MVKPPDKLLRQMAQRGWTVDQIHEARLRGRRVLASDLETGGAATRYVHPRTGRSVVIDDETGEVIHVGGDGLIY